VDGGNGSQWDSVAAFEDFKDDMEGERGRYISGDGGDEEWPRGAPRLARTPSEPNYGWVVY
jgi:hypothetical protein